MQCEFIYLGFFVSREALQPMLDFPGRRCLAKPIEYPHVTVIFRPEPAQRQHALLGKKCRIICTGYGNDGRNEGLLVQLCCDEPQLQALADAIPVPHITLSVSRKGKPVDTAALRFAPIAPFTLEGTFGGFLAQLDVPCLGCPQPYDTCSQSS